LYLTDQRAFWYH